MFVSIAVPGVLTQPGNEPETFGIEMERETDLVQNAHMASLG
jgi:hypothetical protein